MKGSVIGEQSKGWDCRPVLARRGVGVWLGLAVLAGIFTLASARLDYFPGDPAGARLLHTLSTGNTAWAENVTDTARVPARYGLLVIAAALAWRISNIRASIVGVIAFFTLVGFDAMMKPILQRPRPDVQVTGFGAASDGFSFPSTFAMVYGTTFGLIALLLVFHYRGPGRIIGLFICIAFMLIGATARIVLAGHWPSDMFLSYLIALLWMSLLLWLMGFIGPRPALPPLSR